MYTVGNYNYSSKLSYERLIFCILVVFLICAYLLFNLKNNMYIIIFLITFVIDILMIFHLTFRLLYSKGYIEEYVFNEY